MKTVTVRDLEIGTGMPKICIPLTGGNPQEMLAEAAVANELPCELLEIRSDYMLRNVYEDIDVEKKLIDDIHELTEKPVIYTLRTVQEGGWARLERREYLDHIRSIIRKTDADIVDCEAFNGDMEYEPDRISILAEAAHEHEKVMLLSSHDFEDTPLTEDVVRKYCAMNNMEGDILKIAVTPRKEEDVYALLEGARVFHENYADTAIVAISMGETGRVSRICGGDFGSSITFASGVRGTAPGQMQAEVLKQALDEYYREK